MISVGDRMRPDVSIVVVNWNTRQRLERCLAALPRATGGVSMETIVVDNGSTDGSQAMVAAQFPHVRLIQNRDNLGYGRATNVGVTAGTGRYVLILNSDCEPAPGALAVMTERLDRDPAVAGVFCKLTNPDGSLQPSVHDRFLTPWGMLGDLLGLSSLKYAVYRRPRLHRWLLRGTLRLHAHERDVEWGGGACILVRRRAFDAVGGFDGRFFMYYEDVDLCHRLRDAGHRLLYVPSAAAIHHWGASTRQAPAAMLCESFTSRREYFARYFPGWGAGGARWTAVGELGVRAAVLAGAARVGGTDSPVRAKAAQAADCLARLLAAPVGGKPTVLPALVILAVTFSLARYAHDLLKFYLQAPFIDFAHYYTFATVASLGWDAYDPLAVQQVDAMLQLRRAGGGADYPPLFYVFMTPWTWMPFRAAAVTWFLLSQACLFAALMICAAKTTVVSPVRFALAACVAINFQPVLESVVLGQSNLLLLLLLTVAWWGLRSRHPWLVAAALAGAVHIKVQYLLLVAFLGWMGARQAFLRTAALCVAGVGVGMLALGWSHYRGYAALLLESSAVYADWILNLSVRAGLYRLLGLSGVNDAAADGLWVAAGVLALAAAAPALKNIASRDSEALDWAWGVALAAVLLLSPMTEEHHLVVLLLPLMCLLLSPNVPSVFSRRGLLLLGSVVLLASRYSLNQFPFFHHGLSSLAMMGKTAGVAGLALVLWLQLRAKEALPDRCDTGMARDACEAKV
jgi:GT2 family glycosyltransferase